jgi:5-methylcytosine-specific restriction protein A
MPAGGLRDSAMPTAAVRVCHCGAFQPCPKHGRKAKVQAWREAIGTRQARGYDAKWDHYSRAFKRQYPRCGDRPIGAQVTSDSRCAAQSPRVLNGLRLITDHIVPVTGPTDPRFYDETNHQTLCESCHSAKRQREARGSRGVVG